MLFKREEDAGKFFYLYENVVRKGLPDNVQAGKMVPYLCGETLDLYFERFTMDNVFTLEAKNYRIVK